MISGLLTDHEKLTLAGTTGILNKGIIGRMRLAEMLLLLSLLIILMAANVSTDQHFPHSNCPTSCGNISIEYPFGIGDDCFRSGFNLICHGSPPKLFLGDNTTEVLSINDLSSIVTISSPVRIMSVEMDFLNTSWKLPVIEQATFLWKNYASLMVIGCNVNAYVFDPVSNNIAGACFSTCPGNSTSQASDEFGVCDGIGCCNVFIPSNFTTFQVLLNRLNMSDSYLENASAVKVFLTNSFNSYTNNELAQLNENSSVEASLAWLITDQHSCAKAQRSSSYACLGSELIGCYDASDSVIQLLGYFCTCPGVYNGHPYVPNGCQGQIYTTVSPNNCTRSCGDVDVPFPFGLEQGCYRDKSFALTCNQTANGSSIFLERNNSMPLQVVNISVEEGMLEVKFNELELDSIIPNSWSIGFSTETGFSFSWIVPGQLCNQAKNMSSFACVSVNSFCLDANITTAYYQISGYRCKCSQGYNGNPYNHNGCEDVDECKSEICRGICINTEGSYNCIPRSLLLGIIIGTSLGSGMLFLVLISLFLGKRWKKDKQKNERKRCFDLNHGLLLQQLISSNQNNAERTKIFSLEELEKATNNFDDTRIIGHGGHGTVYKGILSDQRVVAIKKSKIVEESERVQFINEVAILSEINHRNIVKLYGCCLENAVPLLVYEFISNGTLSDHLHTTECDSALSWEDRLRIATEASGALAYLHSAASISIFHRDVKSSNILLDDYYTAKVSDFGASRFIPLDQTHVVTDVQGTFGYLDPEYYQTGQLTQKSDVYSFGVILVELLTRQRPTSSMGYEEERNVLMYFLQAIKDQRIFELIEGRAIEEGTREVIEEIIQLAQMCLKLQGKERPTMKEVEFQLQALRKDKPKLEKWATIENEETKHLLQDLYEEIENETSPFTLMSTKDYAPE